MKTNNDMLHGGPLRPEFAQAWANYYTKFIKAYEREAIPPTMKRQGLGDRKITTHCIPVARYKLCATVRRLAPVVRNL